MAKSLQERVNVSQQKCIATKRCIMQQNMV